MAEEKLLELKLLIMLAGKHLPPINLRISDAWKPILLIDGSASGWDETLHLPPMMRSSGPRTIYSLLQDRFLQPNLSYREQRVSAGDVLVLANSKDATALPGVTRVLVDQLKIAIPWRAQPLRSRLFASFRVGLRAIPYVGGAVDHFFFGPSKDGDAAH